MYFLFPHRTHLHVCTLNEEIEIEMKKNAENQFQLESLSSFRVSIYYLAMLSRLWL
jgi:hypothetical protein